MKKLVIILCLTLFAPLINAKEYTVNLVTTGANNQSMVFEPGYIKIEKGDTINFVPSDVTHNAESFSAPTGGAFKTPLNGKATKVKFDKEGVYLYKCLPHAVMGMLGVVQVGKAVNLDQVKKAWKDFKGTVAINKERMDGYLAEVK